MKVNISHLIFLKSSICVIVTYSTVCTIIGLYSKYTSSSPDGMEVLSTSDKYKQYFMQQNNRKRKNIHTNKNDADDGISTFLSSMNDTHTKLEDIQSFTNLYSSWNPSTTSTSFKSGIYERYGINQFIYPDDQRIEYDSSNFDTSRITWNEDSRNSVRSRNSTLSELESQTPSENARLVCMVPLSKYIKFQHAAQYLYPCWSLFQYFPHITNRYIFLPKHKPLDSYTSQLTHVFIEHLNVTLLRHMDNLTSVASLSDTNNDSIAWLAEPKTPSCSFQSVMNQTLPLIACPWFIKRRDVHSLQKAVLGEMFQSGCSKSNKSTYKNKVRILIIDREGDTREWIHARSFYYQMKLQPSFHVRFISNLKLFTLQKQALLLHTSDIIITTHGAQLTNIAYIRPCTAVIELFPRNYYLYFYQLLTLVAGGIHFEGYLFGSDRWKDTRENMKTLAKRVEARTLPMLTSPESLILKLPLITSAVFDCRSNCR